MKARIKWLDHMSFVGESGSGHSVVMDGPPDAGGRDVGIRPMEMMLLGLGGCTAFDVVMILKKARQPVEDCIVDIEAERADSIPSVFTKIHLVFKVKGANLSEKQVAKAVSLSAEKYCSASKMLEDGGVAISHEFQLVND